MLKKLTIASSFTIAVNMFAFAQDQTINPEAKKSTTWQVKHEKWTKQHEKLYQEFVQKLGEAREEKKCRTTYGCLINPVANPMYYNKNPKDLRSIHADCADLPYVLRTYFAWMNDLPLSYPTSITKVNAGDKRDIRYSSGNIVTKINWAKTGDNVNTVISKAKSLTSGLFRIHPTWDKKGSVFTDFYSPKISREAIVPGTIVYDPNGHILVIYKVLDDGRIKMIDAHPDNSLSVKTYGTAFARTRPSSGAGFKNWRPLSMINIARDRNGNIISGTPTVASNSEIQDFDLEQFYGTDKSKYSDDKNWKSHKFVINDKELDYYDYVRHKLAAGNLKYHPTIELKNMLEALCVDLKDRVEAVDSAILAGIHKKSHPERLPVNIYGTSGEWETYSTPSRDARFKASALEIRSKVQSFIEMLANKDKNLVYTGNDLIADLKDIYNKETLECSITYKNSQGNSITLNLDQVIERMFKLSFDPYHCIELRWGASGSELNSCGDSKNKLEWYDAEQGLRNAIERNYDIRMDKSLSELPSSGLGEQRSPDISVMNYLNSL